MTHNVPESAIRPTDEIATESKGYVVFDQWIDQQLELLVARWIHTATPNSLKRDNRVQFGR